MLPATAIYDTVATFGKFTIVAEISEGDFIVLDEVAGLVRDVGAPTSVLLMLNHGLLQFALQVLWVRSRCLKLLEYFTLVR